MSIYSFFVRSEFGIFPDPTITTNKVTYFLPNKSNIIGLLGAIIGIPRSDEIGGLYSKEYLRFLKATKIGIRLVNLPRKIIFFTNHISLKESKTKPFKTEMLVRPEYKIYFATDKNYEEEIVNKIPDNDTQIPKEGYAYTPYLGEAFCLANLYNLKEETELEKLDANERGPITMGSVFIEPTREEYYSTIFQASATVKLLFEYHLLHNVEQKADGEMHLNKIIVKYYIPVSENNEIEISENYKEGLCTIYKTKDKRAVCLF